MENKDIKTKEQLKNALEDMEIRATQKITISDRARPTSEELDNVINAIAVIKNSVVRGQDYETAAKIRDAERLFVKFKELHPEQCMDEEFLSNIAESEVEKFLKYELHERVVKARIGKVAYEEGTDKIIEGERPVFVILEK